MSRVRQFEGDTGVDYLPEAAAQLPSISGGVEPEVLHTDGALPWKGAISDG